MEGGKSADSGEGDETRRFALARWQADRYGFIGTIGSHSLLRKVRLRCDLRRKRREEEKAKS